MKKLVLLVSILFASVSFLTAQTITVHVSGLVKAQSTGAPLPGHEVIIMTDSSAGFNFYATRITGPNGFYDCTINNVPATPNITFIVKTLDCNNQYEVETFQSNNSPAVVDFEICTQNNSCEASFEYSHDSINPLTFHFFSNSEVPPGDSIVAYSWNFGDSTAYGTTQDPWHTFAAPGQYHVCLTITTSSGCTSTECEEVETGQGGGGQCHARFEVYHDTTNQLKFHFFSTSEITAGETITSYSWNFGDSTAYATTQDPWHTYAAPGEYHVCLTITTNTGCTSTECEEVHAGQGGGSQCNNWFSYSKNMLTVNFEGHTHSLFPTTWLWNFGDSASGVNNTSNLQFPQHVYSTPGMYQVTLTTVDSTGCTDVSSKNIHVQGTVDVFGTVHAGDHLVDHGFIELIRVDSNNVLTVVDSQAFGDSVGMYWFGGVPSGHYYLKAELLPASAYYGQFVPTYYEEALNWTNANLITIGDPENPYNFGLRHVEGPSSGNGNISGTITSGAKVNSGGSPAAGVEVLLLNGAGVALTYTKTDGNGQFVFPAVAMGSYTVWPEVAGLLTTPANISLNATNPSATLPFSMTTGQVIYGINSNLPDYFNEVGEIFPNPPVDGKANISFTVTRDLNLEIILYNQVGQVMQNKQASLRTGTNVVKFDVGNLAKGPYFMVLKSSEGGSVIRKLSIIQ